MRNCCSRDLVDPSAHVRDFEPIWLDDYLDYLIVPNQKLAPDLGLPHVSASELLDMVTGFLEGRGGTASSRDIGRFLQAQRVNGRDVLSQVKQRHAGLRAFFQTFSDEFEMYTPEGMEDPEFMVRLAESDADDEKQEARLMSYKGIRAEGEAAEEEEADGAADGMVAGSAASARWREAQRLSLVDLRPLLRQEGLPVTGRKAELLERLRVKLAARGAAEGGVAVEEEEFDEGQEEEEAGGGGVHISAGAVFEEDDDESEAEAEVERRRSPAGREARAPPYAAAASRRRAPMPLDRGFENGVRPFSSIPAPPPVRLPPMYGGAAGARAAAAPPVPAAWGGAPGGVPAAAAAAGDGSAGVEEQDEELERTAAQAALKTGPGVPDTGSARWPVECPGLRAGLRTGRGLACGRAGRTWRGGA